MSEIKLQDLKNKNAAELVAFAEENEVENASVLRKQELLFAILKRPRDHTMAALPEHPAMQRWWAAMADIMQVHPDNEPVAVPLVTLFHMA